MRALGSLLPLVIAAVVYAIVRSTRTRSTGPGPAGRAAGEGRVTPSPPDARGPTDAAASGAGLAADVERWVGAGLVSEEQGAAILSYEHGLAAAPVTTAPARRRRIPAVAEALGYLGGVLAISGLGLIVGRYWVDMSLAGRLALSATAAGAFVAAGAMAAEQADPALARLRWALWLAATAATALVAGIVAADGFDAAPETVVLMCAVATTALSAVLWRGRARPVQQLTFLAGVVVATGALAAEAVEGNAIGLAVWATGAAFVGLGLRRRLVEPVLTEAVGAIAVVVGAVITAADSGPGLVFLVASAFGLLALATVPGLAAERSDRVVLGLLGAITLAQGAPSTIAWFAEDAAAATGFVTWAVGALLVAIGARGLVRTPIPAQLLGGAGLIGGAALTAAEWQSFGPLFGVATAVALVAAGMLPGRVLLSLLGSLDLLINVPWAIAELFPGEGRAPLLIMVSGAIIIAIAVMLTRAGGRFRTELRGPRSRRPRGGPMPGAAP